MAFRSILVPVDYSEPSRRALELALTLNENAVVTVVHAWDRPAYVGEEMVAHPDGSRRSLSELIRDNAEREMTEFLAKLGARHNGSKMRDCRARGRAVLCHDMLLTRADFLRKQAA